MIPHPSLEKAETYLSLQLTRLGHSHAALIELPFITLSRECGAGATTLSQILASELNQFPDAATLPWTVFDGNLLEEMLEANHYPPRLSQYLPEDAVSEFAASVGEIVGLHPNLWELTQATNDFVRRLARLGHCILIGRGSNFATSGLALGTHVRLIGSPTRRAAHVAQGHSLPLPQAQEYIVRLDTARRRYVQRTFGRAIDDPGAYDVVFNTDRISLAEAAAGLIYRVRQMEELALSSAVSQ